MSYFQPVLGMIAMIGFCLLVSKDRRLALRRWRTLAWGLGLQFVFALLVLKSPLAGRFFYTTDRAFRALLGFANDGARFVFGDLADPTRTPLVFGLATLTTIVFFASLMSVLYYVGVMKVVIKAIAWVMARTMGTSGAESLSAAADIFVGMTEAPFTVRPFLPIMTKSELMSVMTVGLATIAGGVMAAYVSMLNTKVPNIAGHLMAASVMAAPAGMVIAKLLYPESEEPATAGTLRIKLESPYRNVMDAAAGGASEGMQLMINVMAMLIAFVGLIAMVNAILGHISVEVFGAAKPVTIQHLLGYVFSPLAWLMGVPAIDTVRVGELMGTKTVINEFVAYSDLTAMAPTLSPRSLVIASYALCGFANFGSVGIIIGGYTILAPSRRGDFARLGLPAMFAGFLATNMTACVAALLTPTSRIFTAALPTP